LLKGLLRFARNDGWLSSQSMIEEQIATSRCALLAMTMPLSIIFRRKSLFCLINCCTAAVRKVLNPSLQKLQLLHFTSATGE
jgi:hypothetical protein